MKFKKNYKFKKENYFFWVSRSKNKERLVCTNDKYLDLLEEDQIIKKIKNNRTILEIGCGNGILLKRLKKKVKFKEYFGTDFVSELINQSNHKYKNFKNISFQQKDMTEINKNSFNKKYDYVISKRAIQNILNSNLQLKVIDNLGYYLKKNGMMILVESSSTAQKNINIFRKKYKLSKIIPPFHNLFFDDNKVIKYKYKNLKLDKIENFSSNYYFISRVINAMLCKDFLNKTPKYNDPLNQIGLIINDNLLNKDFSQIKTYIFKKK